MCHGLCRVSWACVHDADNSQSPHGQDLALLKQTHAFLGHVSCSICLMLCVMSQVSVMQVLIYPRYHGHELALSKQMPDLLCHKEPELCDMCLMLHVTCNM